MRKYLEEIFGLEAKIEKWDGTSKLPLYLRNKKEYYVLSIESMQSILMKNSSDNFNVSSFDKEIQAIEKYANLPVILWLEAISTYQRNALIKNKISFIVPNSQLYVPQFGMCFKEFSAGKREKVEKLSATTQFLLLYFIYQKKLQEISQSELAAYLHISAMNVSRAVQDLQKLDLLIIRKLGTSKMVKPVAIGKELCKLSTRYLQSPVQKKIYVNLEYFDMDLPFAGETALAKQSMLNYPKYTVFAMGKKHVKDISNEAIVNPTLMINGSYAEIELWKYDPCFFAKDKVVDIVSLVQSLKEVEDERVEMQIEEMLEDYQW